MNYSGILAAEGCPWLCPPAGKAVALRASYWVVTGRSRSGEDARGDGGVGIGVWGEGRACDPTHVTGTWWPFPTEAEASLPAQPICLLLLFFRVRLVVKSGHGY